MLSIGAKKMKQKFYMFGISFDIENTSRIDKKIRYVNILFHRKWILDITSGIRRNMSWYITKSLFWDRDASLRASNGETLMKYHNFIISFAILCYIVH